MDFVQIIASELKVKSQQVQATLNLLSEGATVPFIARYRKEATGGLSDTDLRTLAERLSYLTELDSRQSAILKSIDEQKKLTPELKQAILAADTKARLEDLYLPFKPKRRTKAQIAKEAGLEPLANHLLLSGDCDVEQAALGYVDADKGVADTKQALEGARHIIIENIAEQADLLQQLRQLFWRSAEITSTVAKGKENEGIKFSDYFDFSEAINKVPSHRVLAMFRGRKEEVLFLHLGFSDEAMLHQVYQMILSSLNLANKPTKGSWLWDTIVWSWKVKLKIKLEIEGMQELKTRADEEAIKVFHDNLKHLLMAAPAGNFVVLGLDPGFRTGVKTVVVDGTGKLLAQCVIYPHAPQKQWDKALLTLSQLCKKHKVKLISIGNGTASRETDQLAAELVKHLPELAMTKIVVSEAGASVYSASALAAKEFPDLDVSYRGAVSIARRLQDPLAELVKIEPKAIGVGQYQHDVNQAQLERSLSAVVEDCVNAVGADINTASVPLLTSISGLNETTANNIVKYREAHGRFTDRSSIKSVPRLGNKTFEQAAGFLRIIDGDNPLDRSAVHPESYDLVKQISKTSRTTVVDLLANESLLNSLNPMQFVSDEVGLPTVRDIIDELKKPGRDPRPEFAMAKFSEGINKVSDLKAGMQLEGVITNVANFGAFVDIGVHQDGLVHVSQIADHFVKDLHKEVQVGQIVSVRVVEVDIQRNRISLTMKNDNEKQSTKPSAKKTKPKAQKPAKPVFENALSSQLKNAFKR
ncbi:MAG: Tex family protein [Coxiellaceae bacterium]|nr:Tex family protein [Coxiellaceae bacterium]